MKKIIPDVFDKIYYVLCFAFIFVLVFHSYGIAVSPDIYEGDEGDSTCQTANAILPHIYGTKLPQKYFEPQVHNFHEVGDKDFVKFYARADYKRYSIDMVFTNNNCGKCDAVIKLYTSDCEFIEEFDDYGYERESAKLLPDTDGIYYVEIVQYNSEVCGSETEYTLKVDVPIAPGDALLYGTVIPSVKNTVVRTNAGRQALSTLEGLYYMQHEPGSFTMYAEAIGYPVYEMPISFKEDEYKELDIYLDELAALISVLKSVVGINTSQPLYAVSADKNGDGRIGTEEAVYIMQRVSELRD